jgi:hypothetical protein
MLECCLYGSVLKDRWILVFAQDALDKNPDAGAGRFPLHTVDADALLEIFQRLVSNHPGLVAIHHFDRALAICLSVIESDLVSRKSLLFSALPGGANALSQFDQFLDHLGRGNSVIVIADNED